MDAIAERRPTAAVHEYATTKAGGVTVGGVHLTEDDTGLRVRGRATRHAGREGLRSRGPRNGRGSRIAGIRGRPEQAQGQGRDHPYTSRQAGWPMLPYPYGAYASATVAVRDDTGGQDVPEITEISERVDALDAKITAGPVPLTEDQTRAIAKTVAEDVGRAFAERAGTTLPQHALHGLHSLGEMMVAAWKGDIPSDFVRQASQLAERALDDVVTTSGVNAALLTGNLTVRNVAGIVSRGRPAITAFGGPSPIGDVGLTRDVAVLRRHAYGLRRSAVRAEGRDHRRSG